MVQTIHLRGDRTSRKLDKGKLTLISLVSAGLSGLSLFTNFLLFLAFVSLSGKEPPAMVQLTSGNGVIMESEPSWYRTEEAIKGFTQETMSLLMSASGQISDSEGNFIRDYGVELDKGKITSVANIASYGLDEDFRAAFLEELAGITSPDIFNRPESFQNILVVQSISDPIELDEGYWKVIMIANIVRISTDYPTGYPTPFNKEIFVKAIPPPVVYEFESPLAQEIGSIRSRGLEIEEIRNYVPSIPNPDL